MPQERGMAIIGQISNSTVFNNLADFVTLVLLRLSHNSWEATEGSVDNYSSIKSQVTLAVSKSLKWAFLGMDSPTADNPDDSTTPPWYFTAHPVPLVKTSGSSSTTHQYPYYFNSSFQTLHNSWQNALRADMRDNWDNMADCVFWQIAPGSTGDDSPYHNEHIVTVTINGVLQPDAYTYDISDDQWVAADQNDYFPNFYLNLATDLPDVKAMININEDQRHFAWGLYNTPGIGFKYFRPNYNMSGESHQSALIRTLFGTALPDNIVRTELDSDVLEANDSAYLAAPKPNIFASVAHFADLGGTYFCMTTAVYNSLLNISTDPEEDWRFLFDFGNEHLGIRNYTDTGTSWIILRDVIDGADTVRFPESVYGTIIDPAKLSVYTSKYNTIVSGTGPQSVKDHDITALMIQYFYAGRKSNIAASSSASRANINSLRSINDFKHDSWNDDFVVRANDGGNFGRWITQYKPNQTSIGYQRFSSTDFLGRWDRGTDPLHSLNELYFSFDENYIGDEFYTVTFDVYVRDIGNNQWSLNTWNGTAKTSAGTITNTDTNATVKHTFTANIKGGGNIAIPGTSDYCDFTLKTENSSTVRWAYVQATVAATVQGTAGTYKVSTLVGTICGSSEVVLYTDGDFAIGKTLYTDSTLTTVQTGYSYVENADDGHIYNLNSTTGVVGSDTGNVCSDGTAGTYKKAVTISGICSVSSETLYTSGYFHSGGIIYTDVGLTTPLTGYSYIVRVSNGDVYTLNYGTGVIGSWVAKCNGGTANSVRLATSSTTVCFASATTAYTNGAFAVNKTLFTDINLIVPLTGYTYVAYNGNKYSLNTSTGVIGALIASCPAVISEQARLGNDMATICGEALVTLYTTAPIGNQVTLYTSADLTTVVSGYSYMARQLTGLIYHVQEDGVIREQSVGACGGGIAATYRLSNEVSTICEGTVYTLYTAGGFSISQILYADVNLTVPKTGYDYVLNMADLKVYTMDEDTGKVIGTTPYSCAKPVISADTFSEQVAVYIQNDCGCNDL